MAEKLRILHRRGKLYGDGVTKMQMTWAESLKEYVVFDFWLSKESGEFTNWFRNNGSRIYVDETTQGKKKLNFIFNIWHTVLKNQLLNNTVMLYSLPLNKIKSYL